MFGILLGDVPIVAPFMDRPPRLTPVRGVAFAALNSYIQGSPHKEIQMATRQIKMPEKGEAESAPPQPSQYKRLDAGRYLLQVDRQTKGSYLTIEAAQAAGLTIKKAHPVVHVSVYDTIETQNTTVALPTTSQ